MDRCPIARSSGTDAVTWTALCTLVYQGGGGVREGRWGCRVKCGVLECQRGVGLTETSKERQWEDAVYPSVSGACDAFIGGSNGRIARRRTCNVNAEMECM